MLSKSLSWNWNFCVIWNFVFLYYQIKAFTLFSEEYFLGVISKKTLAHSLKCICNTICLCDIIALFKNIKVHVLASVLLVIGRCIICSLLFSIRRKQRPIHNIHFVAIRKQTIETLSAGHRLLIVCFSNLFTSFHLSVPKICNNNLIIYAVAVAVWRCDEHNATRRKA